MWTDQRIAGFKRLVVAALKPPPGIGRIVLALGLGIACYLTFAAAVLAVIAAMFFGLSEGFGRVS